MEFDESEMTQTRVNNPDIHRIVNVLELLDTTPFLKDFFLDMSGFDIIVQDGKTTLIRQRKPRWSDDFTYDMIKFIRTHSNQVTAQTEVKEEDIDLYLNYRTRELNKKIFATGRSHYITPLIWKSLLQYWNANKLDWRYRYISESIIDKMRVPQDFGDFVYHAKDIILDVSGFIKDAKYRSKDGLTLKHHQQVERVTERVTEPTRRQNLLSRLNNMGGRMNDVV